MIAMPLSAALSADQCNRMDLGPRRRFQLRQEMLDHLPGTDLARRSFSSQCDGRGTGPGSSQGSNGGLQPDRQTGIGPIRGIGYEAARSGLRST
jgi:hypothetical protein